jgi:hypothetical protein
MLIAKDEELLFTLQIKLMDCKEFALFVQTLIESLEPKFSIAIPEFFPSL